MLSDKKGTVGILLNRLWHGAVRIKD